MTDNPLALIEDVVAGRYLARETGRPLVSGIRRIAIEPTLEGWEGELVGGLELGHRLAEDECLLVHHAHERGDDVVLDVRVLGTQIQQGNGHLSRFCGTAPGRAGAR